VLMISEAKNPNRVVGRCALLRRLPASIVLFYLFSSPVNQRVGRCSPCFHSLLCLVDGAPLSNE
jgi:hypothetical protein